MAPYRHMCANNNICAHDKRAHEEWRTWWKILNFARLHKPNQLITEGGGTVQVELRNLTPTYTCVRLPPTTDPDDVINPLALFPCICYSQHSWPGRRNEWRMLRVAVCDKFNSHVPHLLQIKTGHPLRCSSMTGLNVSHACVHTCVPLRGSVWGRQAHNNNSQK